MVLGKWDEEQKRLVAFEWLTPKQRARYERRLLDAWEVVRGAGWQRGLGAREVVGALESAAGAKSVRGDAGVLQIAMDRIRGVLNDSDAPAEWANVEPDERLVGAALA